MKDKSKDNISSIGPSWVNVRKQLFTKDEIEQSNKRVKTIGEIIKNDNT